MAIGFWSLGGFVIGLLALPRRISVVDKVASALQPGFAHEGVFVERCLFNTLEASRRLARLLIARVA